MEWYCPNCGAEIRSGAHFCPNCGAKLDDWEPNKKQYQYQEQPQPEPFYQNPDSRDYFTGNSFIPDSRWPVKSKIAYGILAILLGDIGIQYFYMGETTKGIVNICFCWTGIPALIGLIQGIVALCSSDEEFMRKHHVITDTWRG